MTPRCKKCGRFMRVRTVDYALYLGFTFKGYLHQRCYAPYMWPMRDDPSVRAEHQPQTPMIDCTD